MRVALNNSFIRINNALTKIGDTVTEFVESLGQIFRVVNSGASTTSFSYTDINGQTVSTSNLAPTNITYVLVQSGSLTDTELSGGNFTITNLLITSSVSETPTFTEVLFTTVGNGSWTKPEGVTQVIVECWGGGGAGGGATQVRSGGGGGAGGAYARKLLSYSPTSQNISYVVGSGGTGGTGNGGTGNDSTWQTDQVIAKGGGGGIAGITDNSSNGGTANIINNIGDVIYYGSDGFTGSGGTVTDQSGPVDFAAGGDSGGGAGSSNSTTTNLILIPTLEYGGGRTDGLGQTGGTGGGNGVAGNVYGGGGSGAYKISGANRSGGAGAQGLIRIIYR